jgi:hypothetical protein
VVIITGLSPKPTSGYSAEKVEAFFTKVLNHFPEVGGLAFSFLIKKTPNCRRIGLLILPLTYLFLFHRLKSSFNLSFKYREEFREDEREAREKKRSVEMKGGSYEILDNSLYYFNDALCFQPNFPC